MNKLSTIFLGIAFFIFATFTGTSAFAAPAVDCKTIGETVYKGDPRYLSRLDTDADGAICEKVTVTVPPNGGPVIVGPAPSQGGTGVLGPATGGTNASENTGQVDANGNPVKLDSNGNPIQLDEHGNPVKADNLANTGFNAILIWGGIGLLVAGGALIYTFRKLRSTN